MDTQYHIETTRQVLGTWFAPHAITQVIRANVAQDSLAGLFGAQAYRHFCDPVIDHSRAYIESEHALIARLAQARAPADRQRAAFGRLLHTVQDFYSHSNYIDLWLTVHGDGAPDAIDGLDRKLIASPELRVGEWIFWRDSLYYIPVLGRLLRRVWLPPGSHEAMKLDSPAQGPRFRLALATARQRTQVEYRRAVDSIARAGGAMAVQAFHGLEAARGPAWGESLPAAG